MEHTPEEVEGLREDVIVLRDNALSQGSMEWAVNLSHVVKMLGEYAKLLREMETS